MRQVEFGLDSAPARPESGGPAAAQRPPPAGARRAAYCDVDGTLTATQIVSPLVYFRGRLLPGGLRVLWLASLPPRVFYWWLLDKFSREASNRAIYASYAGLDAERIKGWAEDCHRDYLRPRLFAAGLDRLRAFQAEGTAVVLVSGSLDFILAPLARELGAEVIAARLEEEAGPRGLGRRFTGGLVGAPLTAERKAAAVLRHAAAAGVDLAASYALGDALGDLPMLECVGHPIAVNPGRRLRMIARRRGWPVERWKN